MSHLPALDWAALQEWLKPLDALPLECDGLSRAISPLLHREGIEHTLFAGVLDVEGYETIPVHYWVELPQGLICDFRIRMWTKDVQDVPHGVFVPSPQLRYAPQSVVTTWISPFVFEVLVGQTLDSFPRMVTTTRSK